MTADGHKGTFVLGCGAQKAGTSWLQAYLELHRQADFGPIKEYHVFDALELPEMSHFLSRRDPTLTDRPAQFLRHLIRTKQRPLRETLRARLRKPGAYIPYFANILKQKNIRLTGDITPEYAGLSHETLTDIRTGFAAQGIKTTALFIMRDPVERCLSAIRMYRGRPMESHHLPITREESTDTIAIRMMSHGHFAITTRYDLTLARLEAIFGDDLCLSFFEELFDGGEAERIARFLGLDPLPPDLQSMKNVSGFKDEAVSEATRAAVARHFAPVYADAAHRFGAARMHGLWSGYAFLA